MSKKDYQELMEFLAFQFDKMNYKIDQKADKADLLKLGVEVADIRQELDRKANKEDVDRIYEHLDAYAKKVDTCSEEMELLAGQVSRHERWHHETANKLKMKLRY